VRASGREASTRLWLVSSAGLVTNVTAFSQIQEHHRSRNGKHPKLTRQRAAQEGRHGRGGLHEGARVETAGLGVARPACPG
jgi:hypothetical protein